MSEETDNPAGTTWDVNHSEAKTLRRRADNDPKMADRPAAEALTPEQSRQLIHELRAYQIELELQNDELRRTQSELLRTQTRYFELFNLAPIGYLSLNDKLEISEANLTATSMLGMKANALIKQPLSRFVDPEDKDRFSAHFRKLQNDRKARELELRLVHENGNGDRRWYRFQTSRVLEEGTNLFRIRINICDITERKQAEDALRASQERLRTIVDTAISGIITIDQWGIIQMFNKASEKMFGYREKEMIGSNINKLIPEPYRENHAKSFRAYLKGGKSSIIGKLRELQGQRKDGSLFPLNLGIGEFQEGKKRYFTGILYDITEQKNAELALRESEERLALAMEASGGGFWDWNIQTNRAIHNPKWYDMLQLTGTDKQYSPEFFTSLLHKDDREEVLARIQEALEHSGRFFSEQRLRRADGQYIWVRENGIVVKRDAAGKPLRMVGNFVDINEIRKFKQQERDFQNQYERILKLEVANQTIAAIAHELNQPLSAAASYTDAAREFLRQGSKNPEKMAYALDQSAEQIRRAGRVVYELFGFLRAGGNASTLLCVNDVVRKVVTQLREDGQLGEFKAVLELTPNLPSVSSNALMLEKVLTSLICNGIESMHEAGMSAGSISVIVSTSTCGTAVQITIRDSGVGIDEESSQRLFEPFYSTKSNGLGMGLAISRALIEAEGGQLWYENNEGPGATFHLIIPFAPRIKP